MIEPGHLAKNPDGPGGVGGAGRGDGDGDQQTEGIDQDVTLAPVGFLAPVVPPVPARGSRLGRLAVQGRGRRVRVSSGLDPDGLAERVVDAPPRAVPLPLGVLIRDR